MLRRRVEKSGDATRESRTEIDMREPVSVEDLRHADEQALGHVPGQPRRRVKILGELHCSPPELVEDEASTERPHSQLVEPPSGHRTFSRRRPLPSIRKTLRRGIGPLPLELCGGV